MPLRSVLYYSDNVVVDIFYLAVLSNRCLNVLEDLDPGHGVHQACHPPILDAANSPDPANAVDVVRWVEREVVVYHVAVIIMMIIIIYIKGRLH